MNIVLVLSPLMFRETPYIGYAYIAAVLKTRGHRVTVIDLNTDFDIPRDDDALTWQNRSFVEGFLSKNTGLTEEWVTRILGFNPDMVGFTVWATSIVSSRILSEKLKQRKSSLTIIWGGPQIYRDNAKLMIKDSPADIMVFGEGERAIIDAAQKLAGKKEVNYIPGAVVKTGENIAAGGLPREIEELDRLPFPDFSRYDFSKYYMKSHIPMSWSRGCIKNCAFCNLRQRWEKYRSRSAENIFSEIKYQKKTHPFIKHIVLVDPAFNINIVMLSELCVLIAGENPGVTWGGMAMAHPGMDRKMWRKLYSAGCRNVCIGVESGSQKVLDLMGKGLRTEVARRNVREAHDAGIETGLSFMIGFPGETEEDFKMTLEFIKTNSKYIDIIGYPNETALLPGTVLSTHPEKFGISFSRDGWRAQGVTPQVRKRRIGEFIEFVKSLGLDESRATLKRVKEKAKECRDEI